jgi:3-oxoacyl-[acyl-carrier protein] reductase
MSGRCPLCLAPAPAIVVCATELSKSGATAKGFAVDLSDAAAVKASIAAVQGSLGPISTLHWNPYQTLYAPLLEVTAEQLQSGFNLSVTGG